MSVWMSVSNRFEESLKQMQKCRREHLPVVDSYVKNELLPLLGRGEKFTIIPAELGRSSHVYFIDLGSERLVLRGERNRRGIKRRINGHRLLANHDFKVPEIVFQDLRESICIKYGFFFVVETFIDGAVFNKAPDLLTASSELGNILGRMHQITSRHFGWPGEVRWPGNIVAGIKLRKSILENVENYREINCSAANDVFRWLQQQPISRWFLVPRLTTGGFVPSNLIVGKDNRVFLIDLARVRFAFAARDLAQIKYVLLRDNSRANTAFYDSYRKSIPDNLRIEIEDKLPFFEIAFLLRLVLKEGNNSRREKFERLLLDLCT
jgi:Ser/Thr protein kinase RdoA (MazF antagonist)